MPLIRTWQIFVSPQDDCHAALLDVARAAQVSLYVLVFGFTLPDLATILIEKQAAGVHVGVVVDKGQTAGKTQRALMQALVDHGVPVTITTSHGYLMHLKTLIVDAELGVHHNASHVAQGSYNFTTRAQRQLNSLLVSNDATFVQYMQETYEAAQAYGAAHYAQLGASTGGGTRVC